MDKELEQEDPHPDFLKGFNEGYSLAKYAPEIGELFGRYAPETERGKGFRDGKAEYVTELSKERIPELLKDASDNKRDIKEGKERDRDSLLKDYSDNRPDMGVGNADKRISWLEDKDENKTDMDLDRGSPDKDLGDIEPELD